MALNIKASDGRTAASIRIKIDPARHEGDDQNGYFVKKPLAVITDVLPVFIFVRNGKVSIMGCMNGLTSVCRR